MIWRLNHSFSKKLYFTIMHIYYYAVIVNPTSIIVFIIWDFQRKSELGYNHKSRKQLRHGMLPLFYFKFLVDPSTNVNKKYVICISLERNFFIYIAS